MRLLFATPRYGADVVGGAEQLIRDYALHLAANGHDVSVHTTCARDHVRWINELPEGETSDAGVRVVRHHVRPSDLHRRAQLEVQLASGARLSRSEEEEWLRESGHSQDLIDAIEREGVGAAAIVFAPYLFPTTVYGARVHPEKSVVVPCLHDETYARFETVQETLRGCAAIFYNSNAEARLAASLMSGLPPASTIGPGVSDVSGNAERFLRAHAMVVPYIAYAGRRERGKNFPLLLEWTVAYNDHLRKGDRAMLVVMGRGDSPELRLAVDHHIDLGFVDYETRNDAFAGSLSAVNLSTNESFSYTMMEAWLSGTANIVHADGAVTREHCEESGGGLWVRDAAEFGAALDRLQRDPGLRTLLAGRGRNYVLGRYSWPAVVPRLESALRGVGA
jgi:glycosyltransferase involved in cell wall biosynthesis